MPINALKDMVLFVFPSMKHFLLVPTESVLARVDYNIVAFLNQYSIWNLYTYS